MMGGLERVAADRRALIAAQVRCSTGFTWGRAVEGRAVVAVANKVPIAAPANLPDRLHQWVRARSAATWLPLEGEMPEVLELPGPLAAEWIATAWGLLAQRGLVRVRRGAGLAWRGQWLVIELPAGRVHRTAGAPMAWVEGGAHE